MFGAVCLAALFGAGYYLVGDSVTRWFAGAIGHGVSTDQVAVGNEPWRNDRVFTDACTVDDLKKEAYAVADDIVATFPNQPRAIAVAARLQYTFGMGEKAAELWKQCIALDPSDGGSYYGLGLVALDHGRFDEAIEYLKKAIDRTPDDPKGHFLLANVYQMDGKPEKAIEVLEDDIRRRGPAIEILGLLGMCYLQTKQYKLAKQTFLTMTSNAPDESAGYYGLARACMYLGQREEAKKYHAKFRALADQDVKQWYKILPGDFDARRLKGVKSDKERLRHILVFTLADAGRACYALKDYKRAETLWRKAAMLDPEDVVCRHSLLELYDKQGRYDDALLICRALCERQPKNAEHWYNLGLFEARAGNTLAARKALRHAVELDPNNPQYQKAYELSMRAD